MRYSALLLLCFSAASNDHLVFFISFFFLVIAVHCGRKEGEPPDVHVHHPAIRVAVVLTTVVSRTPISYNLHTYIHTHKPTSRHLSSHHITSHHIHPHTSTSAHALAKGTVPLPSSARPPAFHTAELPPERPPISFPATRDPRTGC